MEGREARQERDVAGRGKMEVEGGRREVKEDERHSRD